MTDLRRVLFSTFGSAGDLFPLVPAIFELRAAGVEVRVAARRGLGLYLRSLGLSTVALGDGSELQVVEDPRIFSTRFDGWESWYRTMRRYVLPSVTADARIVSEVIETWNPDVVVASGFAVAARLAARRAGVALLEASIYPQHEALAHRDGSFVSELRMMTARTPSGEARGGRHETAWLWGAPADVLLHDDVLLGDHRTGSTPIGFPSWDGIAGRADDETAMADFLRSSDTTVVVTLGSFIGVAQTSAWTAAAEAVRTAGVRAAFVGARGRWADEAFADRDDICCVGFVPLTRYLPQVHAMVHHGGIGTTFGGIRAGVPALVLPQAFDQTFNARLVTEAGVGRQTDEHRLPGDLVSLLSSPPDVEVTASKLISPTTATSNLIAAITERADRS